MPDNPSPSLAARALERLHKVAKGNGLEPDTIKLLGAEEKIWTLDGVMKLEPIAEVQAARYIGAPRGKNARMMSDGATLREDIERRQKSFRESNDWIPAALKQLKEQPHEGWGLDDVRINLPEQSAVLAASTPCPTCGGSKALVCQTCGGRGTATCNQCNGSRQEFCYNCSGRGMNPAHPDKPCVICNGHRYIPCRTCRASGQMPCPGCQGRRGNACAACNGTGAITEEVTLTCGARTSFNITGTGELPSGMRRGLDRIGIANLGNGYADIESARPPAAADGPETEPIILSPPGLNPESDPPKEKEKPKPEVHYRAHLPFADLRISFNGKTALVSSFGKRGALLGIPAFLDIALEPWREKLKEAANGKGDVDAALGARVMHDALALQLSDKSQVNELRKLYPLGLSPEACLEILSNTRLALNRFTLRVRTFVAVLYGIFSAALFSGIFLTPLHAQAMEGLPPAFVLPADLLVLIVVLGFGWFALSTSISLTLRKRFPDLHIPLIQKIGKTGLTMLVVIVLLFVLTALLAPAKPAWLAFLH